MERLRRVLDILRLINAQPEGTAPDTMIQTWAGASVGEEAIFRVAALIIEELNAGKAVVSEMDITPEVREGIESTIQSVIQAFSIKTITNNPQGNFRGLKASISTFALLLNSYNIPDRLPIPDDVEQIISELKSIIDEFDDPSIPLSVSEVSKKHIEVLVTLLRHIPIFGMEAALATYYELLMKLRKSQGFGKEDANERQRSIWSRIKSLHERLKSVDEMIDSGAKLLEYGKKLLPLLQIIS